PARRPRRSLAAIALAAGAGGALGAGAIAWSLASAPPLACPPSIATASAPAPAVVTAAAKGEPPAAAPPSYFGRPAFAVNERGAMLVLESEVDEAWYAGAPALVEGEGIETVLSRSIDPAQLPAAYHGLTGRPAIAVDDRGRRCPATVGAI